MARMGNFDTRSLKRLQQKLNKLQNDAVTNDFCEACAKELASRLLSKVIERTPKGDYSHDITVTAKRNGKKHKKGEQYTKKVNYGGKKGGTLIRGWTTSQNGSGSEGLETRGAKQFVDTMKVNHYGGVYVIEIVNPVEYASYVEFGHRKVNHSGWVKGKFMMTISEQEIEKIAPRLLEKKLKKFIGGIFSD